MTMENVIDEIMRPSIEEIIKRYTISGELIIPELTYPHAVYVHEVNRFRLRIDPLYIYLDKYTFDELLEMDHFIPRYEGRIWKSKMPDNGKYDRWVLNWSIKTGNIFSIETRKIVILYSQKQISKAFLKIR